MICFLETKKSFIFLPKLDITIFLGTLFGIKALSKDKLPKSTPPRLNLFACNDTDSRILSGGGAGGNNTTWGQRGRGY